MTSVPLADAERLPAWRRPEGLLMLMSLAMPLAFSVWMALLNNFAHDVVAFDGEAIGAIHAIREIPGFLAVGVILVLLVIREQPLALLSLALLGLGTAATGLLPSFWGLALTTLIGSIGFHYFETVNQSLQLQWLSKARAPIVIGRMLGVGSSTAFLAFGVIWLASHPGVVGPEAAAHPPYAVLFAFGGIATLTLAAVAYALYPRFEAPTKQRAGLVLKPRYWLYYAITFFDGARRQIFVVFASFMMVDKFGYGLHEFVGLLIVNHFVNVAFAPAMGRLCARMGERAVLTGEYVGLALVFTAYAFVDDPLTAGVLYVIDHLFFGLAFASRTYFQKIADPEDMAPTAAVAFTINHIAAVTLPWPLGLLYVAAPPAVFGLGVGLAVCSLVLARLVPRRPVKGGETVFAPRGVAAQPAE